MDKFDMDFIDRRIWKYLCQSLQDNEKYNRHGFWSDGYEILCKTEAQAETLANFLEDMGFDYVTTGYYDPEEDERNNDVDRYTGWWYVNID